MFQTQKVEFLYWRRGAKIIWYCKSNVHSESPASEETEGSDKKPFRFWSCFDIQINMLKFIPHLMFILSLYASFPPSPS